MVITKLQLENKLEEYKKIDNLYDVAISVHKKTILDAKKGKLRFTQISDPKLYGLLAGDLTRLHADRDKIKAEITELQKHLRSQPTPEPVTDGAEAIIIEDATNQKPLEPEPGPGPENLVESGDVSFKDAEEEKTEAANTELEKIEAESEALAKNSVLNRSEVAKAVEEIITTSTSLEGCTFPDLATPDIALDQEVTYTLDRIEDGLDTSELEASIRP